MSLSGKIKTISCQIDIGALEPISNSLDFQTIVTEWSYVLCCAKIQSVYFWPLQDVGYCCRQMLMYHLQLINVCYYQQQKSQSVTQ